MIYSRGCLYGHDVKVSLQYQNGTDEGAFLIMTYSKILCESMKLYQDECHPIKKGKFMPCEFPLFQSIQFHESNEEEPPIIPDSGTSLLSFPKCSYSDFTATTRENKMNNQATRLLRLPEVLERTGYGKAWIYRLISEGRFPAPVKIGVRAVAFVESEVDEWIQSVIEVSRNNVA